jgi:CRP-like cAMP-binding protein
VHYIPQFALPPRNRLLAALPAADLARLWPRLEPVALALRQTVHAAGEPITHVYFIETGWLSMLVALQDGEGAEVGLVGREGMAGLPVLLGADFDDIEAMVQAPGTALRLTQAAFREDLNHSPSHRALLLRYALVSHGEVAWTGACNGRHAIGQRLARWLLMAHDRADSDAFPITHEFIAAMLGVRRASVSVAASILQKAGLIHYARGQMTITDRPGLEAAACECYGVVRRLHERLLGPAAQAILGSGA